MDNYKGFERRALKQALKLEAQEARQQELLECSVMFDKILSSLAEYNIKTARNQKELQEALELHNKYVLGI